MMEQVKQVEQVKLVTHFKNIDNDRLDSEKKSRDDGLDGISFQIQHSKHVSI